MRAMRTAAAAAVVVLGLAGVACERTLPKRNGPVAELRGRVRLADGSGLPEYAAFDLVRRPLLPGSGSQPPTACAEANERARQPVELGPDRGLSGVVVAASDFTRIRQRDAVKHRVTIRDCRLTPALIAAQGGDVLEFENLDDFPFEPVLGPVFKSSPLPKGKKVRLPMSPGMESIMCSPSAPCGRTDLIVFFHPAYAVTDARGEFRIPNFPAGEQVRVSAWHPLFEVSENFVWLEPGERGSIDLVLTPKPRFVPGSAP
jgi:hypothetical protein